MIDHTIQAQSLGNGLGIILKIELDTEDRMCNPITEEPMQGASARATIWGTY